MKHTNTYADFQLHPGIRQDLFDAIEYVEGHRNGRTVLGLQLPFIFLTKWAMNIVWKRCCISVSTFSKYDFYTTEALLNDPALWGRYENDGTHKVFGRCVRYFELKEMLPIACINPDRSESKLYQIL